MDLLEGSEPVPGLEDLLPSQEELGSQAQAAAAARPAQRIVFGTEELDLELLAQFEAQATQASQDDVFPPSVPLFDTQGNVLPTDSQLEAQQHPGNQLLLQPPQEAQQQAVEHSNLCANGTSAQPPCHGLSHGSHGTPLPKSQGPHTAPRSHGRPPRPPAPTPAPPPPRPEQPPADMMDLDDMLEDAYMHGSEVQDFLDYAAMQEPPHQPQEAGQQLGPPEEDEDDLQRSKQQQQQDRRRQQQGGQHQARGTLQAQGAGAAALAGRGGHLVPAAAAGAAGSNRTGTAPLQQQRQLAPAAARPQAPAGAAGARPQPATVAGAAARVEAHVNSLFGDDDDELDDMLVEEEQAAPGPSGSDAPAYEPPRLLACEISGQCVPVTSASGLRVYCAVSDLDDSSRRLQWQDVLQPPGRAAAGGPGVGRHAAGRAARAATGPRFNLLSRPISDMMRDAQEAQLQAVLEESRRTAAATAAAAAAAEDLPPTTPGPRTAARGGSGGGASPPQAGEPGGAAEELLWVAKYAPRKFMSLLSDQQTNRQVAQWVKAWDGCVFGRGKDAGALQPGAPAAAGPGARARPGAPAAGTGAGWTAGARQGAGGPTAAGRPRGGAGWEDDLRPDKKVILLCGPPGTGKTTLAHVVAQHCGYHPYEINASDDRTADTLTQRVTDAVQMQPVLGERRPNCVIIDEIDGATGGAEGHSAISALLAIINAGSKQQPGGAEGSETKKAGVGGKRGGRKGRAMPPLSRPIICIANDLYAPALRPLRDVAQVFHFKAPDLDKLVLRLTHICAQEGVNIDKAALVALAHRCDCDIRTCLNTLQFLAKQQGARPRHLPTPGRAPTPPAHPAPARTPARTRAAAAGTAGAGSATAAGLAMAGLTSPPPTGPGAARMGGAAPPPTTPAARTPRRPAPRITLQQVEQLPIGSKDTAKGIFAVWDALLHLPRQGGAGGGAGGRGLLLDSLHRLLQDLGEYELVMSGLQENLLGVRYLDVHLKHTSQMCDALAEADLMLHSCRKRMDFHMLSYVPGRLLLLHLLAAQPEKPHLQWPKALAECGRRCASQQELLRSWAGYKVSARVLQAHHVHNLAQEVVPALLRLLSPSLRPLAPSLLNPSEQALAQSCVHALVAFGLRYGLGEDVRPGPRGMLPAGRSNTEGELHRPVPLDPALDVMHMYNAPKLLRGPGALRPVPLVLRQMLNQQATLEAIRQTQATAPGPEDEVMTDAAAAAAAAEASTIGRMLGVRVQPLPPAAAAAPAAGGPPAAATSTGKAPLGPHDANAGPSGASGSKPTNWLDALRVSATNKRKAQAAAARQQQQQAKRQATGAGNTAGPAPGMTSPAAGGKHQQFAVLYRYNEGYTNAVKRPLLMKELLGPTAQP